MSKFPINQALEYVFGFRYFAQDAAIDGKVAIPYIWTPGAPASRVVLVLGENAGGKSFFRRLVRLATYKGSKDAFNKMNPGPYPVEFIHLSMEGRTGSMYGPARAMAYGDEEYDSTGYLTASTVTTAIRTATSRDGGHNLILYWDEPDIGMSARAAAGIGVTIREWVNNLPEHVQAVFITTHSPHLVAEFLKVQEHSPHYVYLGSEEGPKTVQDWLVEQTGPRHAHFARGSDPGG